MLEFLLTHFGLKSDRSWRQFLIRWMGLALLLHGIAAILSAGFYHADEHFQIVEFANFKLGRSAASDLPLEFRYHLRPWLFPTLLVGLTKCLTSLGIHNPFTWALSYRFFSSFLGWLCSVGVALCCYSWFSDEKWRNRAVMSTVLIWYMPAFHARHSSENLGGIFFFIGLTLLVGAIPSSANPKQLLQDANDLSPSKCNGKSSGKGYPEKYKVLCLFWVGILFGFAFEFRYQVAFMIVGLSLWLLIYAKLKSRQLLALLLGFSLPVALGTLLDFWGYGEWTFAPWNYLQYNIIQNHVSDSDTSPGWDYFRRALTESWPPLGLLLLISFVIAWFRHPRHILTWSTAPFFIAHVIIGHKELRFLFPLLHVGGALFILSLTSTHWIRNWPGRILLFLNGVALITLCSIPAWMPIRFYAKLYEMDPAGLKLYSKDSSLFSFGGVIMNFYRPPHLMLYPISNYQEIVPFLHETKPPLWLFHSRFKLPDEANVLNYVCQPEFSTFPTWFEQTRFSLSTFRNTFPNITNWTLFRCQKRTL